MFRSKSHAVYQKERMEWESKMIHNMGVNDMFKDFTSYGGEGNGMVI